MPDNPRIVPLGDSSLVVDFGNDISPELNDRSIALASRINRVAFPGIVEAVPAYASVAVFYEIAAVRSNRSAFETVSGLVQTLLNNETETLDADSKLVEIPVDFAPEHALDLPFVSTQSGLSQNNVIELFTSSTYRVYMLGFLPGFAYMADVDERIAIPRRDSPRVRVPKGSVGIAGRQTGVYPFESPGGWQIIGATKLEMFDAASNDPCPVRAGDLVKFTPINQ